MPLTVREARTTDAAVIADFNAALALETEHKQLDRTRLEPGVREDGFRLGSGGSSPSARLVARYSRATVSSWPGKRAR